MIHPSVNEFGKTLTAVGFEAWSHLTTADPDGHCYCPICHGRSCPKCLESERLDAVEYELEDEIPQSIEHLEIQELTWRNIA